MRKTIDTHWEVWTYDVWGNEHDGYDVNDRYNYSRDYIIRCKPVTYNPNTKNEFVAIELTDNQLQRVFGVRCNLTIEGDDIHYYIYREKDYCPIGELNCISHASLSPVRMYNKITENVNLPD